MKAELRRHVNVLHEGKVKIWSVPESTYQKILAASQKKPSLWNWIKGFLKKLFT